MYREKRGGGFVKVADKRTKHDNREGNRRNEDISPGKNSAAQLFCFANFFSFAQVKQRQEDLCL